MSNDSNYQLIPLQELSAYELETLREEFVDYFNDSEEFYDFIEMQMKWHPQGIRRDDLMNYIGNFALNNAMNGLRRKLGEDVIKEHTTDDGITFYSLGDKPVIFDEFI